MNAASLTGLMAGVSGVFASVFVPLLLRWRESRSEDRQTDVVSWQGLNQALNQEVGRVNDELRRVRSESDQQIADLRQDYEHRLDLAQKRITELEEQVDRLTRRATDDTP